MTLRPIVLAVLLVVSVVSGMALGIGAVAGSEVNVAPDDLPGSGTANDPYQISNTSELQAMEGDVTAHYELVSDIGASETSDWNGGNGFDPIGYYDENDSSTRFTGSFDGNGYTVSNLVIDRSSTDYVGLFGMIGDSAVVENTYLANVEITGNNEVGGLVGADGEGNSVDTRIFNSTVTGAVNGNSKVGGIVGWSDGEIQQSAANVDVTADKNSEGYSFAGGLAGFQFANGTISSSYATGKVIGAGSQNGGLVGYTIGKVKTSYATGAVRGGTATGGFSGTNGGNILNSYSVGEVNGHSSTGGFSGVNGGTITDSYWDTESSGQPSSDGGTGLTTDAMSGDQATSNMSGFDFTNTWGVLTDDKMSYPYLQDNKQRPAPGQVEESTLSPAYFEVSIEDTNSPISPGETLEVSAKIRNTGDLPLTQPISLRNFEGDMVNSTDLALSGGMSKTVTLSWNTDSDDAGIGQITVESWDDNDTRDVWVQEPANFSVAINDTNSPVVAGKALDVNATVTNEGGLSDTQTIELRNSQGSVVDTESVTVDGSDSTTRTLSWSTSPDDVGNESITVACKNDSATREVTIQEPANTSITIDDTNSPITEGETLEVTATATNDGQAPITQTIELRDFNGTVVDSTEITIPSGNSDTVNLAWTTDTGDVGSGQITVESEDDTATRGVWIRESGDFSVAIDATNSPVMAGETLEVTTTVTNGGGVSETKTIELQNSQGSVVDTETVTLDSGSSTTRNLSWSTSSGDVGEESITVRCGNDSATREVTIQGSANFSVTIYATNSPVIAGETLDVTATVTNEGNVQQTQTIYFQTYTGAVADSKNLTLNGGNYDTVDLSWSTNSRDVGTRAIYVSSEDQLATHEVTVQQPDDEDQGDSVPQPDDGNQGGSAPQPEDGGQGDSVPQPGNATQGETVKQPGNFSIEIENTSAPVKAGENLDVTARVTNTGDKQSNRAIILESVAGDVVDTDGLTLGGGESTTVTLTWATSKNETDDGQITVACEDDSDSTPVTITEGGIFDVEITDYDNEVEQGDTINLTAQATNTNGSPATHPVEFRVDGTEEAVEKLELESGETETIAFDFVAEETGENRVLEVASPDDSASVTVTVSQPSTGESDPLFNGSIQPWGAISMIIPWLTIAIIGYGLNKGESGASAT